MSKSKQIIIPQAHSYDFFDEMMLEMHNNGFDQDALAKKFEVQRRTISYYVQLGRWLKFLKGDAFTTSGKAFVNAEKKERVTIFKTSIQKETWVANAVEAGFSSDAFDVEIAKVSDLAEATRRRRARALSKLWISILQADGTMKKAAPTKKKKIVRKKKATEKKEVKKAPKKVVKKTAPKKAAKKAKPVKKPEIKSVKKTTKPKKTAPKKAVPKKAKKAATQKTKTEYKYKAPVPNKAPDHPLLWVGKKVVKSVFKVAGKVLRFL